MKKSINLITQPEDNNLRVDVFVNKKESTLSRTRIKNLILKEKLKFTNTKVYCGPTSLKKITSKNKKGNPEIFYTNVQINVDIIEDDKIKNKIFILLFFPQQGTYHKISVNFIVELVDWTKPCKG